MNTRTDDLTPRTAAKIAGFGLLTMAILAFFAYFFILEQFVVSGDASTTVENIGDAQGLFRLGIAGMLGIAVLDVIVAATLYLLLKPINHSGALLMAILRLVYAGMLGISLFNLVLVSEMVHGTSYQVVPGSDQFNAQVMLYLDAFTFGWMIGLVFFGLHLLVLGYMIYRSGSMPALLGILLMVAAVAYIGDSFANILIANYADYETVFTMLVAVPSLIGELSLMFWLLFRGGTAQSHSRLVPEPA